MAKVYERVHLASLKEDGKLITESNFPVRVETFYKRSKAQVTILNGDSTLHQIQITKNVESARVGSTAVVLTTGDLSLLIRFASADDVESFTSKLQDVVKTKQNSAFAQRTDPSSAEQYFQFYGYLSQQQNMMQDYIRTSTYQRAMLDNCIDFTDKVVLDVGAGSGILSFFAIQAGARKVYAIEASSMAEHCEGLVHSNKLSDKIEVIYSKVEEVELPEKVDVIISEPMGYMLFNERMLESYLHAKKWLKPHGKMFPTQGDLHITPFTDESLYMEQFSKANFWYQQSFHGVDLADLRPAAVKEYFKQPIVDTFDIRICMARSQKYTVDFQTAHETDLHHIEIPVIFTMLSSGPVHGLAFWFDVAFIGAQTTVWLSTSPTQPLTHWYQVRCLLQNPIFVKQGQTLAGKVVLRANKRQSYDVDIELTVPGTNTKSSNTLDLKNPFFRYTGQQPLPPPGTCNTSPSDDYWTQEAAAVDGTGYSLYNGGHFGDGQAAQYAPGQSGVAQSNLVPLANVAPINPGSIPAATIVSAVSQALQSRTSVGGGISPSLFTQTTNASSNNMYLASNSSVGVQYPISSQFMIGDYMVPGNMVIPTQGLNVCNYKTGSV